MDDLDRQLIALLRHDARQPVASLSAHLGISRATVRARIDRLMADGVILGFTLQLGEEVARRIAAVMLIEVEGRVAERVARQLLGFPDVQSLHSTNGRWDLVAELASDTLEDFDLLLNRIRLLQGIVSTETSIKLRAFRPA